MEVSVIIVSYNVKTYLAECLSSVQSALKTIDGEIIVFDNNSKDNTVTELKPLFPKVRFIASKENFGFAKANNKAVEQANGEFVLILNPDTLVPEDLFQKILPFAKSKSDLGALGVKLIDGDGKFHPECKRNMPSLRNTFDKNFGFLFGSKENAYYNTKLNPNENGESEVLVGAFMLMQKSVYEKVGGFDEDYFMYGEDIDLSFQLLKLGYKNYYFGESTVIHYKGKSTKKDNQYLKIFYGAMHIFIDKHYKTFGLNQLLHFAVWFRHLLTRYVLPKRFKETPNIKVKDLNAKTPLDFSENYILLNGAINSNSDLIDVIESNHKNGRFFYTKSKIQDVIIGNHQILTQKEEIAE